jgi:hypothetical protein
MIKLLVGQLVGAVHFKVITYSRMQASDGLLDGNSKGGNVQGGIVKNGQLILKESK